MSPTHKQWTKRFALLKRQFSLACKIPPLALTHSKVRRCSTRWGPSESCEALDGFQNNSCLVADEPNEPPLRCLPNKNDQLIKWVGRRKFRRLGETCPNNSTDASQDDYVILRPAYGVTDAFTKPRSENKKELPIAALDCDRT
jgi:hypothetical protein